MINAICRFCKYPLVEAIVIKDAQTQEGQLTEFECRMCGAEFKQTTVVLCQPKVKIQQNAPRG